MRRGRALVESCVALTVLATAGTLLLLSAYTSAHLVDSARMNALAAQHTTQALADVARRGCRGVAGTEMVVARLRVITVPVGAPEVPGLAVRSVWRRAPLAGGASGRTHVDSSSTAVWCEP